MLDPINIVCDSKLLLKDICFLHTVADKKLGRRHDLHHGICAVLSPRQFIVNNETRVYRGSFAFLKKKGRKRRNGFLSNEERLALLRILCYAYKGATSWHMFPSIAVGAEVTIGSPTMRRRVLLSK
jgi:hypothetical protein